MYGRKIKEHVKLNGMVIVFMKTGSSKLLALPHIAGYWLEIE